MIVIHATLSKQRTKSTLHRNMYGVHCAADCTASTAGGLISFDIDASLIYVRPGEARSGLLVRVNVGSVGEAGRL